eukprot:gene26277-biopygen15485
MSRGVRDRNRAGIEPADPTNSGERIMLMMNQPLITQIGPLPTASTPLTYPICVCSLYSLL